MDWDDDNKYCKTENVIQAKKFQKRPILMENTDVKKMKEMK